MGPALSCNITVAMAPSARSEQSLVALLIREQGDKLLARLNDGPGSGPAESAPAAQQPASRQRLLRAIVEALETGEPAAFLEEERRLGLEGAVHGAGLAERAVLQAALGAGLWESGLHRFGSSPADLQRFVEEMRHLDSLMADGLAAGLGSYQVVAARHMATLRQVAVRTERERLARELHELAQELANVATQANLSYVLLRSGASGAETPIGDLRQRCDALLDKLHAQIEELRGEAAAVGHHGSLEEQSVGRRVLVVDRSREIGLNVAQLLDEEYAVSTCHSGESAQALIEGGGLDLLLLGLEPADQEGIELCRRLRQSPGLGGLPIILLLDPADAETVAEGLEAGASDYVSLPLQRRELRARVAAVLRSRALNEELETRNRTLEELSLTDPLTGLANRRYLVQRLEQESSEAQRYGQPLGLLMVDIDHFKAINDSYGHEVGDRLLVEVAAVLRGCVRQYDVVARFGGEEFVVVLPQTPTAGLLQAAQKIQEAVAVTPLQVGTQQLRLTVSVGGAVRHRDESPQSLIQRADQAMYEAKRAGRNTVRAWQPA